MYYLLIFDYYYFHMVMVIEMDYMLLNDLIELMVLIVINTVISKIIVFELVDKN